MSSDFVNHSYDYRPNWTPLSPITIINLLYKKSLEGLKRKFHMQENVNSGKEKKRLDFLW